MLGLATIGSAARMGVIQLAGAAGIDSLIAMIAASSACVITRRSRAWRTRSAISKASLARRYPARRATEAFRSRFIVPQLRRLGIGVFLRCVAFGETSLHSPLRAVDLRTLAA